MSQKAIHCWPEGGIKHGGAGEQTLPGYTASCGGTTREADQLLYHKSPVITSSFPCYCIIKLKAPATCLDAVGKSHLKRPQLYICECLYNFKRQNSSCFTAEGAI